MLDATGADARRGRGGILREELAFFVEIAAVSAFAITQPILDVFGRSPETFVFRRAEPRHIVLFAAAVAVGPAVLAWVVAALTRVAGARVRRAAQLAVLGVLAAFLAVVILKRVVPIRGVGLAIPALALGAGATFLVARRESLRSFIRFAALAQLVFVGLFLVASPSSKLLRRAALAEPAAEGGGDATPIVMVIFDELPLLSLLGPDGTINETLYPNLARLADSSTWYRDYTVTEPNTPYSVPTILSGRIVRDRKKTAVAVDHPQNMFSILRRTHELRVFESVTDLCPDEQCASAGPATRRSGRRGRRGRPVVGVLLRDAAGIWRDLALPGEVTRDVMGQFGEGDPVEDTAGTPTDTGVATPQPSRRRGSPLRNLLRSFDEPSRRPALTFAHVMLPHTPWRRFPSGRTYRKLRGFDDLPRVSDADPNDGNHWSEHPWPVAVTRQRHLLQVAYVDRLVGEIVGALRSRGLYDRTTLVITSDHGMSLHPGRNPRSVGPANAHEVLWVPLFIKAPGQARGAVSDENLMAIDLLPTLASMQGIRIPQPVDGLASGDRRLARRTSKLVAGYHTFLGVEGKDRLARLGPSLLAPARRRLRTEAFVHGGPPNTPADLQPYLIGPRPELIGEPLDRSAVRAPGGSVRLDLPALRMFGDVDTADGPLPALILGRVVGEARPGAAQVAVAINGRIAGVSPTYPHDGHPARFAVLTPEHLFRDGRNRVEFFLVDGTTFRPLRAET